MLENQHRSHSGASCCAVAVHDALPSVLNPSGLKETGSNDDLACTGDKQGNGAHPASHVTDTVRLSSPCIHGTAKGTCACKFDRIWTRDRPLCRQLLRSGLRGGKLVTRLNQGRIHTASAGSSICHRNHTGSRCRGGVHDDAAAVRFTDCG